MVDTQLHSLPIAHTDTAVCLQPSAHLPFSKHLRQSVRRKRNIARAACLAALIPFFWPSVVPGFPAEGTEFLAGAVLLAPLGAFAEIGAEHLSNYFGAVKGGFAHSFMSNFAYLALTTSTLVTLAHSSDPVLRQDVVVVIQRSIAGTIVIDMLLLLGIGLLISGLKNQAQTGARPPANIYATMLTFSVVVLMLPGLAFLLNISVGLFDNGPTLHINQQEALTLSTLVAGVLFALYIAYVLFLILNVRAQHLFEQADLPQHLDDQGIYVHSLYDSAAPNGTSGGNHCSEPASSVEKRRALVSGLLTLTLGALGVVLVSERMAHTIEAGILESAHLNPFLVGFLLVPILSSLAELVAIASAGWHGDIQTCLALTAGSAIQVALFVAPVLVFSAHLLGVPDMNLLFSPFVLAMLFLITFSFRIHFAGGRTNWLEGVQLLGVFTIIMAIGCLVG